MLHCTCCACPHSRLQSHSAFDHVTPALSAIRAILIALLDLPSPQISRRRQSAQPTRRPLEPTSRQNRPLSAGLVRLSFRFLFYFLIDTDYASTQSRLVRLSFTLAPARLVSPARSHFGNVASAPHAHTLELTHSTSTPLRYSTQGETARDLAQPLREVAQFRCEKYFICSISLGLVELVVRISK